MKIGIVKLNISNCGKAGYYNDQEIGLAKKLRDFGHDIHVYFCVSFSEEERIDNIGENITIHVIPTKKIGTNALLDTNNLDTDLDAIVCPCDIQLSIPKIYKWSLKKSITFIPYIGTINSKSSNKIVRLLMNINKKRIVSIYRKVDVVAKTNALKEELNQLSINNVFVAPVGLDFDLLNKNYLDVNIDSIKAKYGYNEKDKVVLLIGRIEEDRNPLDSVAVIKTLFNYDNNYRLLIVGKGSLEKQLKDAFEFEGLDNYVKHISQIPNENMWEVYRMADRLISFSKTEIFGMSILEAMYYETPVFVVNAPGPNDIIKNKQTGFLYLSSNEMSINIIKENIINIGKQAHDSIVNDFSWDAVAKTVESIVNR